MKNILVIFGGRSAEHEVSVRSARNVIAALDKKRYNPVPVVISRMGVWYLLNSAVISEDMTEVNEDTNHGELCSLMRTTDKTIIFTPTGKTIKIDAAFPVTHGPMGEDGTLQGVFEMMLLPYVGCNVLSSAIGMDKDILKNILGLHNIPVTPSVTLTAEQKIPSFKEICIKLGSEAVFIKPSIMGSSVGVSKAKTEDQFKEAVTQAFKYSFKVLVEKFIPCREIECSVLGNNNPIASELGEIKPNHEFYSYEAKYLDPNGADLIIPAANLSPDIVAQIQDLAVRAFKAAECKGMARVDFFVSHDNKVYVNELNTLPGFTSISMYPKLLEASGINYTDLMTKLLDFAFEEFDTRQSLSLMPDTDLMKHKAKPKAVLSNS